MIPPDEPGSNDSARSRAAPRGFDTGSLLRIGHSLLAVLVVAAFQIAIQRKSLGFTDPDGYYHARWSALLGSALAGGHLPSFRWLPLTILSPDRYADHHFLYHVMVIPFTWGTDLLVGAKASAIVYGSLGYLSCYALIVWSRVRYPLVWLLLLVGSSLTLLARMSLPRAPALMIVLLAATVWLLLTKRYLAIGPLTFVAVWTYSLFPLIGVFCVIWAATVLVKDREIAWRPIAASVAGSLAGLVLNPYFPNDVWLFFAHLTKALPGGNAGEVVGNEWAPMTFGSLVTLNTFALLCQTGGLVALVARVRARGPRELDRGTIFLGATSLFLLAIAIRSVRFVEYWALFSVVFAAFASRPLLELARVSTSTTRRILTPGLAAVLAVLATAYPVLFVRYARVDDLPTAHPEVYEGVANWLATNTPEGSLVYNVRWEDFPALFFYDTRNVYVGGLDPTYLSFARPDLGRLYADIGSGAVANPGREILERFGSRYIVATVADRAFMERARVDPSITIGYSSPLAVVLVVNDAPKG